MNRTRKCQYNTNCTVYRYKYMFDAEVNVEIPNGDV